MYRSFVTPSKNVNKLLSKERIIKCGSFSVKRVGESTSISFCLQGRRAIVQISLAISCTKRRLPSVHVHIRDQIYVAWAFWSSVACAHDKMIRRTSRQALSRRCEISSLERPFEGLRDCSVSAVWSARFKLR